jgi:DNA polymerase IIIc chi subunit
LYKHEENRVDDDSRIWIACEDSDVGEDFEEALGQFKPEL